MFDYKRFSSYWEDPSSPLQVQWSMGNVCNWDCEYCPDYSKAGDNPWPDMNHCTNFLNQLFDHVNKIDKKVHIDLIGGEVTLFPQFKQLAEMINSNGSTLSIFSNGSRTVRFWEEVKDYLNTIVISYHPLSNTREHLTNVIDVLLSSNRNDGEGTIPTVNFACVKNYIDEIIAMRNELHYYWEGRVNLELRLLRDKRGHRKYGQWHYDYTQEEIDKIMAPPPWHNQPVDHYFTPTQQPGEIKIVHLNDSISWHNLNDIIVGNMNVFKGMYCNIGRESIVVDFKGNIRTGYCQHGSAGHISDGNINFPSDSHVLCQQESCFNLRDLQATKFVKT